MTAAGRISFDHLYLTQTNRMRLLFAALAMTLSCSTYAQAKVETKKFGTLEFIELEHGSAKAVEGTTEQTDLTPTGSHGWLKDLVIVEVTDSIKMAPKATFGTIYMIKAKDTVDIEVTIEWIYPGTVVNEQGQKFKSVKYGTTRPTNIPSGSTYSLDAPYEMVKGDWTENIYLGNKRVFTRTFTLY